MTDFTKVQQALERRGYTVRTFAAAAEAAAYLDGAGNPAGSLGVHEHWNNAAERLYSRDRGEAEGIELFRILR